MNKTELIKNVAQNAEISQKEATVVVQTVVESITNTLAAGEKVQLIGFGTFEVRERAARTGRNPQTGEEMQIAASKVPAFKAGKELKEAVIMKNSLLVYERAIFSLHINKNLTIILFLLFLYAHKAFAFKERFCCNTRFCIDLPMP